MGERWKRFAAAYRMELRILCLHWSYPALHLAWALLLWYLIGRHDFGTARSALEREAGKAALGLITLIALFVGGAVASRSERTRFAALEDSFPTGAEVLTGRWLAAVTGLMGALIAPLVISFRQGPLPSFLEALPIFLLEAFISLGFAVAVAWWLIYWLGARRWVYPLMAVCWFPVLMAPDILRGLGYRTPLVTLLDFMRQGAPSFNELWARAAHGTALAWFNLFLVALTAVLLSLIAWRVQARRMHRRPSVPALALALAVLLAGTSGVSYYRITADWHRMGLADRDAAAAFWADQRGETAERITDYAVAIDLNGAPVLRGEARLTLENQSRQPLQAVDLTLYHSLQVLDASLPYKQEGNYITLQLPEPLQPGASLAVALTYEGPLTRVNPDAPFPELYGFVTPGGARLPTIAGWYPVAGRQPLEGYSDLEHPPAAFQLTINAPASFTIHSNLPMRGESEFSAEQATWAYLVASPRLETEQHGMVTLVAPRHDMDVLRPLVPQYEAVLCHHARFFPNVQIDGLTLAALDTLSGFPQNSPPTDGQVLIITERRLVTSINRYTQNRFAFVGRPLVADLWVMNGGSAPGFFVLEEVGSFLWHHLQTGGDTAAMKQIFGDHRAVAALLTEAYETHGEAGVIRLLEAMKGLDLHPHFYGGELEYWRTWVQDVLRDAD